MADLPDFSISGYSAWCENPIWLWKVDPIAGESLTSWVARLSAKMQISIPRLLAGLHLSENEIKADLDVNPPMKLIQGLASKTGESEKAILGMTLIEQRPKFLSAEDIQPTVNAEVKSSRVHWITPSGWTPMHTPYV